MHLRVLTVAVPGGGDGYREFILPGMFAMTMAFGLEATMMAVSTDAAKGVTDRFRAMPMAPSAASRTVPTPWVPVRVTGLTGVSAIAGEWRSGYAVVPAAVRTIRKVPP